MSQAEVTPEAVQELLADFPDPETGRSLAQNNQFRDIQVDGNRVSFTLALTTHSAPLYKSTQADLTERIRNQFSSVEEVNIELAEHTRPPMQLGTIGLKAKSVVAVGSGKGGVGKSTIAAALAFGLQRAGCKVGLMDADVYGPSIPHLLGVEGRPELFEMPGPDGQPVRRMKPIEAAHGLKVMSIGFFVEPDQAVIWRGPMLHGTVMQFLRDCEWGELDYLIIDMPPGTGDVALSLSQILPATGAVVVCTPQDVALLDAVKALNMFGQVKIPVLGMVENMSYFICPDCDKRYDIFGSGGARKRAGDLGVPFLGDVPINISIRELGDEGETGRLFDDDTLAQYFEPICYHLAKQIADRNRQKPSQPSLPVL